MSHSCKFTLGRAFGLMCAGYKDRDQFNVHDVSARGMNGWAFGFPIEEERLKGKHLKAELVSNKEQNIGLKCSTRSKNSPMAFFCKITWVIEVREKKNITMVLHR